MTAAVKGPVRYSRRRAPKLLSAGTRKRSRFTASASAGRLADQFARRARPDPDYRNPIIFDEKGQVSAFKSLRNPEGTNKAGGNNNPKFRLKSTACQQKWRPCNYM